MPRLRRRALVTLILPFTVLGSLLVTPTADAAVHYGIHCGPWAHGSFTLDDGYRATFDARTCIERTRSTDGGKAWVRAFVNVRNSSGPIKALYGHGSIWRYTSSGLRLVFAWDDLRYATSPTGVGRAWGTKFFKVDARRKFWGLGRITYDFSHDHAAKRTDALTATGGW